MPAVFRALGEAAAENVRDLNAQGLATILWAMAKTGMRMPAVFKALCAAAAQNVQDFNAQELANTLRAMARAGLQCARDG